MLSAFALQGTIDSCPESLIFTVDFTTVPCKEDFDIAGEDLILRSVAATKAAIAGYLPISNRHHESCQDMFHVDRMGCSFLQIQGDITKSFLKTFGDYDRSLAIDRDALNDLFC